jgi:prepilin-type N-terminal cleavage/methylation domain-containing protein
MTKQMEDNMSNNRGFTLIEMVVVLAVVAILAAILTPTIAKNINDAKIARANNEVQVIAGAVGSFFKDTGRWPTSDGTTLTDTVQLLYTSSGEVPALDSTVTDEEYWLSDASGWSGTLVDTFEHHLVENNPGGGATNYPDDTTSPKPELRWKGPYITELKADPWGNQYSCNIWYTFNTTTNAVGVWSAGPNRIANTSAIQAATAVTIGGDDILYRIQ